MISQIPNWLYHADIPQLKQQTNILPVSLSGKKLLRDISDGKVTYITASKLSLAPTTSGLISGIGPNDFKRHSRREVYRSHPNFVIMVI